MRLTVANDAATGGFVELERLILAIVRIARFQRGDCS